MPFQDWQLGRYDKTQPCRSAACTGCGFCWHSIRSAEACSGRKAVASVARGAGMHTAMKSFGKRAPGPPV